MNKNIESISLLRGVCLILMVFINFFDEIAKVAILNSKQGICIDFIVTSMVPSVFIAITGFLIILRDNLNSDSLLPKALKLLTIGYLLNIARIPVPQMLGNILGITKYDNILRNTLYHFSIIDIYPFVGYALIISLPLIYFRFSNQGYFILSTLIIFVSSFGDAIVELLPSGLAMPAGYILFGTFKNVYFPIFPWIAYLFLGMGLGFLYQKNSRKSFYSLLFVLGSAISIVGYAVFKYSYNDDFSMLNDFYHHDYTVGIFLIGLVCLILFFAEILLTKLPQVAKSHLEFSSKNIVGMYTISWLLIGWFITLRGLNNNFSIADSIFGALIVYFFSFYTLNICKKTNFTL